MKTFQTNISGLDCLEVCSDGKETVGIVLLHGYGANMHDLFPLWELWHEEGYRWYFPNGIQSLPMGYYEGRSWFSIDVNELERAIREGRSRDLKNNIPPEFDDTLFVLKNFLQEISNRHKRVIIGGFSQGAMCASHLAVDKDLNIAGLILLSGNLLAEKKFPSSSKSLPFYQSHGTKDPILSIEGAKDLESKLKSYNFQGCLSAFDGGHEIPQKVIMEVKSFLKNQH